MPDGRKKRADAGFSLVELIIVIAIMAVLIGVLAPQYLKYVKQSKISTDIDNAQQIATAVSAAIADNQSGLVLPASGTTKTVAAADIPNIDAFPVCKLNSTYNWVVTIGSSEMDNITLGGFEIWPNPDDAANGYRTKH